jgi:phosphoglycerate dehydrogenase-like enzyme
MPNSTLTIWSNAQCSGAPLESLRNQIKPHRLVFSKNLSASNLVAAPPDPALAEADVALGQPDPKSAMQHERLRWIHLTSAGYTRYDNDEFRAALSKRGARLTNSSGVYDEPCAEHVFSMMLALARRLPQSLDKQRTDHAWPSLQLRSESRLLLGQNVVLLGFGAIGRRLAQMLAPFGMNVTAVRRNAACDESVRIIGEGDLDSALAAADHVVNILPENPGTKHFVTARRFAAMKSGAIFYNIGRGTTIEQDALLASLRAGHLAAAYLDVTDPEPLPPEHPLWTTPNCFITPHTAGGHDTEMARLVKHFLENLKRFTGDSELLDRVI